MSDQTPTPEAIEAELVTLRKLRDELLATKTKQKAKIDELELQLLQANERADKATATMRASAIDVPLRKLAAEASPVPDLFLAELQRDYAVDVSDDGSLLLKDKDGKLVTRANKPLPLTHNSLYQLLTDDKSERAPVYRTIMKYSGATGGVGAGMKGRSPVIRPEGKTGGQKAIENSFGLR